MTIFGDLPHNLSEKLTIRETETDGAVFSEDENYRYMLRRQVNAEGEGDLVFIMLNPSTADETVDDHTISVCRGFALKAGYEWLTAVNLFAWRSKEREKLLRVDCPVGSFNDRVIEASLTTANRVIMAWGGGKYPKLGGRSDAVRDLLKESFDGAYHLGLTQNEEPRHPQGVPYSRTPKLDIRTIP